MAVTHGTTSDHFTDAKHPGVKRYFVAIADASTKTSLLAALGENIKGRVVSGRLNTSAAGSVEIYQGDAAQAIAYDKFSGGAVWILDWPVDRVQSLENEALKVLSDAAIRIDGFLDVVEMGTGAL